MKILDLTNPKVARQYCKDFNVPGHGKATFVRLSTGREVYFETMSDDDAIMVAGMLADIELQAMQDLPRQ